MVVQLCQNYCVKEEFEQSIYLAATNPFKEEINEEFVALSPKQQESEKRVNNETIKVIQAVYVNDEIINDEDKHDDSETRGSANNDDDSDENDEVSNKSGTDEDNEANSFRRLKILKKIKKPGSKEKVALINKCEYCRKCLRTQNGLIKHIIKRHDKNYYKNLPYQCPKCIKGFKSRNGLKFHLRVHGSLVILQCPLCPVKLRRNLATHIMTHESETCFPCQVCGEIYPSHEQRLEHWETHATDLPFGCNICYRRYKKRQYLLKHLKCHKSYKCYFCKEEFNSPLAQRPPYACRNCEKLRHVRNKLKYLRYKEAENMPVHNEETPQPQPLRALTTTEYSFQKDASHTWPKIVTPSTAVSAESFFPQKEHSGTVELLEQQKQSLNSIPEQMQIEQIANEDSNTNFSTKPNDDAHKDASDLEPIDDNKPSGSLNYTTPTIKTTSKGGTLQYKCQDCKYTFATKKGVLKHLAKCHRKNKPFKCEPCNKGFKTKHGYRFHIKTHDKNNQLQCPVCPITVFREWSFVAHVMLHEDESCFPCQVCAKIFPSNAERVAHYQPHIKERPYGCDICYRRFYHHHFLSIHMKSHGVYNCNFCPQHFNSTEALKKPYVCGNCEKLPDIKSTVEHQRSLASKKHVFESDDEE